MPSPLYFDGVRLPASYANFYICNAAVIVPTFNDPNDRVALGIFWVNCSKTAPVVGIHAVDVPSVGLWLATLSHATTAGLLDVAPASRGWNSASRRILARSACFEIKIVHSLPHIVRPASFRRDAGNDGPEARATQFNQFAWSFAAQSSACAAARNCRSTCKRGAASSREVGSFN